MWNKAEKVEKLPMVQKTKVIVEMTRQLLQVQAVYFHYQKDGSFRMSLHERNYILH